jgi:hypothetical protein
MPFDLQFSRCTLTLGFIFFNLGNLALHALKFLEFLKQETINPVILSQKRTILITGLLYIWRMPGILFTLSGYVKDSLDTNLADG